MNYIIRKMQKEDIPQVQQVAKITWNTTYIDIMPQEIQHKFLASAYSDEMMVRRLNVTNVYVAEVNDKVVGFANFSQVKNEGEVELAAIYLDPAYHGKGIGTALLKTGINDEPSVRYVFINVEKENLIGRKFYEARGFNLVEEIEDDLYGHLTNMLRMVSEVR